MGAVPLTRAIVGTRTFGRRAVGSADLLFLLSRDRDPGLGP